ncbi:MAG TPA: 2-oxo acid dehydrogenase subunit E2 [Chloroflexia bacterium]|nr:2-oxo acid dehydrogenase subunit E2 [Chloroflexia bacterium]
MNKKIKNYHVVDLPLVRRVVLSFVDELSSWEHYMYGLLEVDVTVARQLMEEYKGRTGERLSFTGYLAFCLARAVDQDKSVQAYLKGRKQLVMFDDVDVGMMVERQIDQTRAPVGFVIRRANQKSFMEIHREIRAAQAAPAPSSKEIPAWLRLLLRVPWPLTKLLPALVRLAKRRDPARMWVAMAGTVGISAVGMFGNSGGWGLAPMEHSLCLIVGGIARKPVLVREQVEPREILNLTVVLDHDVIDGAPAARFTRRLVELIESGYGLQEGQTVVATEFAATPSASLSQ